MIMMMIKMMMLMMMMTGHGGHTMEHNLAYYSQLTKKQVWGLYNLYRVDHELFGYTANAFIDVAQ